MYEERQDFHEILRTLSGELISVFEKPGTFRKYVHTFWRLKIIPDETNDDLQDSTKAKGLNGDAHRLSSVLYKLAKSRSDDKKWQLLFFNYLLGELENGNEDHVAIKIRTELGSIRGILPKREPKISVAETRSFRPAQSAPIERVTAFELELVTPYETPDRLESNTGGVRHTQLVQTINDAPQQVPNRSNIVAGGHPHQPTSNDRSAPPYISTFSGTGYMNHPTTQMHEETQMAVRRTANEVATNSFSSEEIRLRSTRLSQGEIYFGPELRQLLLERDEHLRKVLDQQHERENQRLVTKTREESSFEIINSRLQDINTSTREIERVVKNLETNESEHRLRIMNTLGAIEKRVEENNILLFNICVAGFVLSSCYIFIKTWLSK